MYACSVLLFGYSLTLHQGLARESTVDFYSNDRSSARKVYNRSKNRYTNVLPCTYT